MTVGQEISPAPRTARLIRWEIFIVFAISLGASGLNALLDLIGSLLARPSLRSQKALLVGSLAANHWLDLILQLVNIAEAVVPVALVIYLVVAGGERPSVLGVDASQPGKDALRGAALAALIGGTRAGPVPGRVQSRGQPERGARVPARALVADTSAAAERRARRHPRGDRGHRATCCSGWIS